MSDLESLRKTIDQCDEDIAKAIERRFKTVKEIVKYKKNNNMEIFQPERERKVLEAVDSYLCNKEFSEELESLYIHIMKLSKEIQEKILLDN